MGVDCRITLYNNHCVRDVATIIAILAGNKPHKEPFNTSPYRDNDGWYIKVDGVTVKGFSDVPGMVEIFLNGPMLDGELEHYAHYHYEWGLPDGGFGRGISPKSTAFWIAVGIRLVDFFGGEVDYQDCDNSLVDYRVTDDGRSFDFTTEDNESYYRLQEKLLSLQPLTQKEIEDVEQYAAYKKRG